MHDYISPNSRLDFPQFNKGEDLVMQDKLNRNQSINVDYCLYSSGCTRLNSYLKRPQYEELALLTKPPPPPLTKNVMTDR
jgi:hypothetical protein